MSSNRADAASERLDAREIEGNPFDDITAALAELAEAESLLLVNGFEPTPLYDVLERRGFAYETTRRTPTEWHVEITRA